jgi:hypothetical protein
MGMNGLNERFNNLLGIEPRRDDFTTKAAKIDKISSSIAERINDEWCRIFGDAAISVLSWIRLTLTP